MLSLWVQLRAAARQHLSLAKVSRGTLITVQVVCAWHLFSEYVGGPRFVAGPSMLPTMNLSGDLVLEDCLSCRLSPPRISRGDLVTFYSPREPQKTVCKRVMGLPGDTVCIDPSRAIRTSRLAAGYMSAWENDGTAAPDDGQWGPQHVIVPEGHIWVAGDNTSGSRDSRAYGPIPIALVRGRIFARLYPSPRRFRDSVVYID